MENSGRLYKKTLRCNENINNKIAELKDKLCMSTEHSAIIMALLTHARLIDLKNELNLRANKAERELANLKRKIANVQLAYIDLTMSVIADEEE